MQQLSGSEQDLRERALANLKKKREFRSHVLAYLAVNTSLIVIWAVTGAAFFWPVFPLLGWGVGLFFHGWDTYSDEPSDARIRREMDHLRARS